eukprot:TRINITY_DN2072_c0_g1_i1.p1 TRINITY_DN2072_c0_g1~~TRINITY_DN2072_c0_g1_i1.p1  ORF type:complete len:385 (+),score=111.29 TRINITY_DN2072_c0_g1_i1:190-1344(+)
MQEPQMMQSAGMMPTYLLPTFQVQPSLPSFNTMMMSGFGQGITISVAELGFNNNNSNQNLKTENNCLLNESAPTNGMHSMSSSFDATKLHSSRSAFNSFSNVPTSSSPILSPVALNPSSPPTSSPALEHIRQEHLKAQSLRLPQSTNHPLPTKPVILAFNSNSLSVKTTPLKPCKSQKSSKSSKSSRSESNSNLNPNSNTNTNTNSNSTTTSNTTSSTIITSLGLGQNNGRLEKEQREQLRKVFEMSVYLSGKERKVLAESLGIPEKKVQIWFQNERAKMKRRQQQVLMKQGLNSGSGLLSLLEEEGVKEREYKDPNSQIQGLQRLQGLQGFQAMQRGSVTCNSNNNSNGASGLAALIAAGDEKLDPEDEDDDEEVGEDGSSSP